MASDGKGCRDLRPLIRSRCKGVLKQDNERKGELSCVTWAEFGGDWSSWSEFTVVFLRWISRAASLECPTLLTARGETPHMKGVGMLVVSLRGVNFGFWSHLGCTGQNAIIFSREGLHAKKYENIYLICIFLMCHSYNPSFLMCLCFNMVSYRGKKKLGPRPDRSPLGLKFKISD